MKLPGRIIAESVANSRGAPKPAPIFLHLDADAKVVVDAEGRHRLTHINGKELDEDKE